MTGGIFHIRFRLKLQKLVMCLFFVLFVSFVTAQVSVSPLLHRFEIGQTGQTQTTFTVFNGSAEPVRFRATFSPFNFANNTVTLLDPGAANASDLSPYLRAAPLEFAVPASSEQNIRVIVLLPPSAVGEELRAALTIEPLDETPSVSVPQSQGGVTGTVSFIYRFVAQIYASQPGGNADITLGELKYNPEDGLLLGLANSGNITGISNTVWQLTRGGEAIVSAEQPARYLVIPGGRRTATLTEDLRLEPGDYTLTGTFGTEDGGEPPVVLNPQPFTKTFTVK